MTDPDKPLPSLEEFDKKLLRAAAVEGLKSGSASSLGLRLGAEFASGVLVGVGIGMLLDRWLDSSPWAMILCMCLGTAAGVRTMMGTIRQFERQQEKEEK